MISSCSCKSLPQSVPNSFGNLYLYCISLPVAVHRRRTLIYNHKMEEYPKTDQRKKVKMETNQLWNPSIVDA
ncbi:hypothetical protein A4A49_35004 [Nicotiana attenuata]|uniref:Uncharacterized protein n=1 Tax=Nicotiana attenuata TaxID=49451 RepID=A0A314KVP2_NICAT|nr:hypothetical protein A4A49_35004 [Nicotiana attenuata]